MKALVTGCAGFIGSHLAESLLSDGWEVIGVDCFNANYGRSQKLTNLERARSHDSFTFVPVDLARGDLEDIVEDCAVVYHLAAEPGVRTSWGEGFERYVRNNILATQHLLEALAEKPGRRLVYASSSSIYGSAESLPTPETAVPAPVSPYGVTKLAAEHLCNAYRVNHGLDIVTLRYFTVYGPRQRPDMAFAHFCEAALTGEPINLFGDGGQTRDFTFVQDAVNATRKAGESEDASGRVFNIGGGSRVSINQVLELIKQLADRPLNVIRHPVSIGDVRDTGADTSEAKLRLSFNPCTSFEEGFGHEFEWVASQQAVPTDG